MSSFKKATKASDLNKSVSQGRMSGVKPWVNGLSLVSSGIRELDDILGGGHVLGSMCLLHEDTHSNHADTVMMYSLAEAISQNHKTLLVVRDAHEAKSILSALPFNMNKGSLSLDKKKNTAVKTSEEEEEDKKRHLKIAWQYGKYIKDNTSSSSSGRSSSSYCSSYDLSNRLQPDVIADNMPRVYCYEERKEVTPSADGSFNFDLRSSEEDSGEEVLAAVLSGIHDAVYSFREVHSKTQSNPVRVFIPHYEAILRSSRASAEHVGGLLGAQLLLRLKHLMQHETFPPPSSPGLDKDTSPLRTSINDHIRMTVFATIRPSAIPRSLGPSCLQTLNSLADTVLGVESFAGHADSIPVEFRYFCGFFFVHKLQQIAAMAPHRPSACRFGLKRDRRKLHIEPLHLPPEDSRASKYQSETSLGVKQDKGQDKHSHSRPAASTPSSRPSASYSGVTTSSSSSNAHSLGKKIQQISLHGNDASRHVPAPLSPSTKALCASSLPSARVGKKTSPKDLEF